MLFSADHTAEILTGVATSTIAALCLLGRNSISFARLFSVSDPPSLMSVSSLGALHCICHQADGGSQQDDRRKTCRACGSVVLFQDPTLLYEPVSRAQIRDISSYLRRLARQARRSVPSSATARSPKILSTPSGKR